MSFVAHAASECLPPVLATLFLGEFAELAQLSAADTAHYERHSGGADGARQVTQLGVLLNAARQCSTAAASRFSATPQVASRSLRSRRWPTSCSASVVWER
jgi:hypothetical protein